MDRRYKKRIDRYWIEVENKFNRSLSALDYSSWFDYWHSHIDWKGKGDSRTENRFTCLELSYKLFQLTLGKIEHRGSDVQCWWSVHEESWEDGIYLHSENDNDSPYPYGFDGVSWGTTENKSLNDIVDLASYKIGMIKNQYGTTFVVCRNA